EGLVGSGDVYKRQMEGSLDVKQLEEALQALIERHESLRTAFVEIDGVPVQKVYRRVPFTLEAVSYTHLRPTRPS
ncbi:condensation domain-containing protein, partial [Bacillus pumilus]